MVNKQEFVFKDFTALTSDEHELILQWRNNPLISRWMLNDTVTTDEHHAFVERLGTDKTKKYWLVYLGEQPIGTFYLTNINDSSAEIGLYMNPDMVGKGLGQQMLQAAMDFTTHNYSISTLHLEVLVDNAAAIHVYQKFGFKKTGMADTKKGPAVLMQLAV